MANVDTVPAPPITEAELWDQEMPHRPTAGRLYACEVMAYGHERGEVGGSAPYESSYYRGYGLSPEAATQAANAIGEELTRSGLKDDDGLHPTHGWGADEYVREVTDRCCTGCGQPSTHLTPWPTVFGCKADSGALCPDCVARETEECGCPTALECDCADVDGHLYEDRLTLAECGYPMGHS